MYHAAIQLHFAKNDIMMMCGVWCVVLVLVHESSENIVAYTIFDWNLSTINTIDSDTMMKQLYAVAIADDECLVFALYERCISIFLFNSL